MYWTKKSSGFKFDAHSKPANFATRLPSVTQSNNNNNTHTTFAKMRELDFSTIFHPFSPSLSIYHGSKVFDEYHITIGGVMSCGVGTWFRFHRFNRSCLIDLLSYIMVCFLPFSTSFTTSSSTIVADDVCCCSYTEFFSVIQCP